eukprot:TRINITY_DN11814_c0_g1_i1.p1 TRINITY_DN11814_c0_g1~~TRINITY_DN11814_c0_g1_i1.p1  ORF type:complete len:470 (+),score=26.74 TRINITY_DN11814_c0_g1_i1:51-1460(+)
MEGSERRVSHLLALYLTILGFSFRSVSHLLPNDEAARFADTTLSPSTFAESLTPLSYGAIFVFLLNACARAYHPTILPSLTDLTTLYPPLDAAALSVFRSALCRHLDDLAGLLPTFPLALPPYLLADLLFSSADGVHRVQHLLLRLCHLALIAGGGQRAAALRPVLSPMPTVVAVLSSSATPVADAAHPDTVDRIPATPGAIGGSDAHRRVPARVYNTRSGSMVVSQRGRRPGGSDIYSYARRLTSGATRAAPPRHCHSPSGGCNGATRDVRTTASVRATSRGRFRTRSAGTRPSVGASGLRTVPIPGSVGTSAAMKSGAGSLATTTLIGCAAADAPADVLVAARMATLRIVLRAESAALRDDLAVALCTARSAAVGQGEIDPMRARRRRLPAEFAVGADASIGGGSEQEAGLRKGSPHPPPADRDSGSDTGLGEMLRFVSASQGPGAACDGASRLEDDPPATVRLRAG